MNLIFLYAACIVLSIISIISIKRNMSYKKDFEQTLILLDSILQNYYSITKEVDIYEDRHRKDSVIADGNMLLQNYDNSDFNKFYSHFLNEYGRYIVIGNERNTYNYSCIQTKLIQIQYLIDLFKDEHQSYFQVDLIGIETMNSVIKHNTTNRLKLFIVYEFLHDRMNSIYPKVEIDGDTLFYEYPFYYYDYLCKEKGEHIVNANIIEKRWGDTISFPVSFKIMAE